MSEWTRMVRNERGGVAVLVAIAVATMLGFAALAIDLGMLIKARTDAQRAADAAALAGASAFMDFDPLAAVGPARTRAGEYGQRNTFLNGPIDPSEIYVKVTPESLKVGVYVYRDSVQTWFARIFGIRYLPIGAYAAAVAANAGAAKCLKPWAVPDIWHDANGDVNGNRWWDPGENWKFGDDPGDRYEKFTGPRGGTTETGYGSRWRNGYTPPIMGDYSRRMMIKSPDPNSELTPSPGIFLPWRLPVDPNQAPCDTGGGGGDAGGAVYRRNICSCNASKVELGVPYEVEPGNMIGPTFQGVSELISEDPNAYWYDFGNGDGEIRGSSFADPMDSPRVIKVALIDPMQIQGSGMQTIMFNNFALLFLEAQPRNQDPVQARFLYYASGEGSPGSTTGSLVKVLQLVK